VQRTYKHIVQTWMLSLMLSLTATPILAQDTAEMSGLHCGDVVTITATPDAGYRFVRWSDGNTDNPREIEITDAVNLSAIYEPVCQRDAVPVVWLYGQLLMVDVESLHQLGYTFSEQNVAWYRIVGDMDATSSEHNDEQVATGYYYVHDDQSAYQYYVAVDISGSIPTGTIPFCSDTLYGQIEVPKRATPPIESSTTEEELRLVPNYGLPGTAMDILGLNAEKQYAIQVYDAVGRRLEDHSSLGVERYTIIAQPIPGYYLIRVTCKNGETVLRYVVKQ